MVEGEEWGRYHIFCLKVWPNYWFRISHKIYYGTKIDKRSIARLAPHHAGSLATIRMPSNAGSTLGGSWPASVL